MNKLCIAHTRWNKTRIIIALKIDGTTEGEIDIDGDRTIFYNEEELIAILMELIGIEHKGKYIVFVNDLYVFYEYYKDYINFTKPCGGEKVKIRELSTIDDAVDFRNLRTIKRTGERVDTIEQCIDVIKNTRLPLNKIRYSPAHCALEEYKTLYPKTYDEMSTLAKRCYLSSMPLYKELNKEIVKSNTMYFPNDFMSIPMPNVSSFDISSYFPFELYTTLQPVSKPIEVAPTVQNLDYLVKKDYCIDAVVVVDRVPRGLYDFTDGYYESKTIYLTEISYKTLQKYYKCSIVEVKLLFYSEKGLLPMDFRASIRELYDMKTKDKHYKLIINCLIGQMAKRMGYNTHLEIIDNDIEAVIVPIDIRLYHKHRLGIQQWAVRVYHNARAYLYDVAARLPARYSIISIDTDCFKVLDVDNKAKDFFDNENKKIRELVGCNLGCWKHEWTTKYFETAAPKVYWYLNDDNKVSYTIAGVPKSVSQQYKDVPIESISRDTLCFKNAGRKKIKNENGRYELLPVDWTIEQVMNNGTMENN